MTKRVVHEGRVTSELKTRRGREKRGDAGDTLIEVLLALVVLSLASVALIIAFGTSISASADHRDLANYNTVLASAEADMRSQVDLNPSAIFGSCPTIWSQNTAYPTSAQLSSNLPSSDTASIISVQYWNGATWSTSCSGLTDPTELITIQIADRSSKQPPQDIQIVISDPITVASAQGTSSVAAQLVFVTQPAGATYNSAFTTQPVVEVESSTGQLVNSNLSYITMSIQSGPSGAVLSSCNGTESSGYVYFTGCSLNETGTYQLEATLNASNPANDIFGYSAAFAVSATQLYTPAISSVVPSTITAGALNVTFTGSSNAPSGQTYTVKACTDSGMSLGCVEQTGLSPGSDEVDNLYPGTQYYVQVTAVASTDYLPATSPPTGPVGATIQLLPPGTPTLTYGASAGSINVTFAPSSNAAPGQTYTVDACTSSNMLTGCVTNTNFTSGTDLTGLTYSVGSAGQTYYVEIVANLSTGYLASTPSTQASQIETSQVAAPGKPTVTSSASTAGVINATFTASTGVAPAGYTAQACTSTSPLSGCTNAITALPAGTQFTGLMSGVTYYVVVTATPPSVAYVSNTSAPSNGVLATVQLAAPSVTLGYGTVAGSLSVTAASSNAPSGQTYNVKACTNTGMSTGCVTNASFTSGSNLTGLAYTPGTAGGTYYVQVSANASTGYLASAVSAQASHADTSQLAAPGAPTATPSTTTAGALNVTFAAPTGQAPNSYTVTACTNTGMSTGCVTNSNVTSGGPIVGLVAGTAYYENVTAISTNAAFASSNASSTSSTSVMATVQLAVATNVTVVPSTTTAGALGVTFTAPSNGPSGQIYSAMVCSNLAMTANCVTQSAYTSGAQITGFTGGSNYYATITATASTGYLASTSAVSTGVATIQLAAPTSVAVTSSTTTAGAVNVTFAGSSNAAPGQTYAITTCTNPGMSTGCATKTGVAVGGGAVTTLTAGTNYYVTVVASASTGYLASAASTPVVGPTLATVQLTPPTNVTVTPSTGTAGALKVSFTAPTNAGGGQTYTATACTNSTMTTGCMAVTNFTSGGSITTLTPGQSYYVTVAAPASTGYLASISTVSAATVATVQLAVPSTPTLGYGTAAGSLTVTSTSSNAPSGQTYTVEACTNVGMSSGCVTNASFTSGSNLTGLADTPGIAGGTYYVEVSANASTGYLASGLSAQASHADTSQLAAPGTPSATSSTTTAGALNVTFAASTGQVPNSYTVTACTNMGMSTGCVGPTTIASGGGQLTGLVGGSSYYLSVSATSTNAAFVSSNASATSGSSYLATSQLNAITFTSITPSTTTAGVIAVVFSGPSNAPGGQTYTETACTNMGMSTGCVGPTAIAAGGGNISSLIPGTQYYIQITAPASAGYLAVLSSASGPTVATVQLTTPSVSSVIPSTTTAGALVVNITGPTNAPAGQTFAVTACSNPGMTSGCVTQSGISTGGQITTLVQGTKYYVYVVASASTGYLVSAQSATTGTAVLATVQLTTPTISGVAGYGTNALTVNFTGSTNGPGTQSYSAEACTVSNMTGTCFTNAAITSGSQITGLAYRTYYYVTVTANPSSGYLPATSSISARTQS